MVVILLLITVSIASLLYLILFKDRFFCRYNSTIDVPIELLSKDLSNLTHWQNWLPWLIFDNDADITYEYLNTGSTSDLPSRLIWQSPLIKTGHITLEPANSSERYFHTLLNAPAFYPNDLHFNIGLAKQKKQTLITIQLTGKLPFLKRWRRDDYAMRANKDIELALLKLLAYLAKYNQNSDCEYHKPVFEWLPQTRLDNVDAVTRPFSVRNQPMSQKMDQGFHNLITQLGPENPPSGPSFALYNKVDLANHDFSGRLGIPIQNLAPCELCPERIVLRGYYLQLRYYGPYQNLSLAWHIIYSFMRLHNLKLNRRRYGVEVFEVGPAQVECSKKYITLVCLPIK
ncbi:AraC family transcriptional regulator [Marinomonas colpomeniae]|uniref:AraC family transcriptional regulator n=1 Tax=Marinomonas colpomeniae TaxID=2774408 RepID=A0ABR8NTX8_9GAMM|nr:AraC family transcriptional regulator [Marinomonas colpomeniae]MBD5769500.1 AraC family transcriptional regulator [Marinomonas colpomeniae]